MSDFVVFPEQISFDVRVQRSNPRRRLTLKNLGTLSILVTFNPPQTDSFIVTDSKGKTVDSMLRINLLANSQHAFFVQKKSTVGIVPEDKIIISSPAKTCSVALKPAVSLVSLNELDSVIQSSEASEVPSLPDFEIPHGRIENDQESLSSSRSLDPTVKQKRNPASKIPRQTANQAIHSARSHKSEKIAIKQVNKPAINKKDVSDTEQDNSDYTDMKQVENDPIELNPQLTDKRVSFSELQQNIHSNDTSLPQPSKISSPVIRSGIPRSRHSDPDGDVLEQSLNLKFSFKEDDFSTAKKRNVFWYDDDCFQIQEPDFSLELMMTGDDNDPIFCIDGDYFDASGRLLSVQEGKSEVIFVTEQGNDIDDSI